MAALLTCSPGGCLRSARIRGGCGPATGVWSASMRPAS